MKHAPTNPDDDPFLKEIVRLQFQKPIKDGDYYCITLLGNDDGTVSHFVDSYWIGFTETKPQREIRKAITVEPTGYSAMLNKIEEPGVIVNNERDLSIFFLIGGHGIIIKSIAERFFPHLIDPHPVVRSLAKGFTSVPSLPDKMIQHAPSKKLRMKILKRDDFRCLACGRSPNNYVDLELHVHHIVPWGLGGITEEDNLITLCGTCHDGLDPHYEPRLFELVGIPREPPPMFDKAQYAHRLLLYMNYMKEKYLAQI